MTWLKTSIQTDLAEIQGGKLAESKSKNPAVLKLARTMVADHTNMLKSGRTLARHYHLTMPTAPSPSQKSQMASVSSKSGTAFDQAFLKLQVTAHIKAIKQTKAELAHGSSTAVKSAAKAAMGMLQMHLRLAEAGLRGLGHHP